MSACEGFLLMAVSSSLNMKSMKGVLCGTTEQLMMELELLVFGFAFVEVVHVKLS
jgi:hypothetical protein